MNDDTCDICTHDAVIAVRPAVQHDDLTWRGTTQITLLSCAAHISDTFITASGGGYFTTFIVEARTRLSIDTDD